MTGASVVSPPSSSEIASEELPPKVTVFQYPKLPVKERAEILTDPETQSHSFKTGQQVYYFDGLKKLLATIKNIYDEDEKHTYTIEVDGRGEVSNVDHVDLSVVHHPTDPTVNKVLGILNLHNETDNYLRVKYPTLKEFENFLKLSVESVKAIYKQNGESKEPLFKRSDREEFIILSRWTEKNQVEGKIEGVINWGAFNQNNFNDFCEQALKDDLFEILRELGIYNDKVVNTLEAKSVLTPAHFAQKPKSWYDKLCEEEPGTEENSKQTKHLLLSGEDKYAIEKFKDWYNFHFIGYLPSDWIVSFRNYDIDVHPNERDLRKVLRVIGLKADAIEALKMNDIKDIATLNRTSEEWKTKGASGYSPEQEASRSYEWKDMGLTRYDASDIINFRHWFNFYVADKKNVKGWVTEFNRAQYNSFLQRYEPGDNFKKPSPWKFWQQGLKLSQVKQDFIDDCQKAVELGEVTEEQRYRLRKYMEEREKMSVLKDIISNVNEGLGDSTLQDERLRELRELFHRDEQRCEEEDERDLLFGRQFCQFFFKAFLVLVLLGSWVGTTVYFMMESLREKNGFRLVPEGEPGFEPHSGFDYVTFIHNVLFGLVTAVVIQELGEEETETSLYYRFRPTYREQRRRQRERRVRNRNNAEGLCSRLVEGSKTYLMWVILWSTRLYIIFWICLGAASLGFGAIKGIDTSNPLYTTGQTWLGITVTIGHTFFGLNVNGKNAPKPEDANDKIDHSNKDDGAVQGTTDGNDGANGREEARFTEPPVSAKAASASKKKQQTSAGNSTAPSTSKEKQAAEVTADPPSFESFEGMKSLGHYKDEYGTTFEKYQATPDGNCLPYAVNGSNDFQKMMKTRIGAAQYIELNRSQHYESCIGTDKIDQVIAAFRKVKAYLGNEFLQVFADWTGDTIVSYVTVEDGDDRVYTFTPSSEFESANPSGKTRFVIYNNRNHYDGLRLIDDDVGLVGNENSDKSDDDDDGISSKEKVDKDSGHVDEEEGDSLDNEFGSLLQLT